MSKDHVYVVWEDATLGEDEVFFVYSDDNGQLFSQSDNLSNSDVGNGNPELTSIGNHVYVVWIEETLDNDEIFFVYSDDNGQSFSQPDNLSNNDGESNLVKITANEDNVYVVWEDDTHGNKEIFFVYSDDNGQSFSQPDNLSNSDDESSLPEIDTYGENVYVVWIEETLGNNEIFFVYSDDNGQSFSQPDNLSNNDGFSQNPQIVVQEDSVYLVWYDSTPGNFDIFFAPSTNNGQTFTTPENISNTGSSSLDPKINTNGENVYVVWQDDTPGNEEIFFVFSNNNGISFSQPDNISSNDSNSFMPQIATN